MATTFDMVQIGGAGGPFGPGEAGAEKVAVFEHDLTAALVVNDVMRMPYPLEEGTLITDVTLYSTDNDTSTGLVYDVGYDGSGADADYFIDGATIGQAGGRANATGAPLLLDEPRRVQVLVQVAPSSGTTSGNVTLVVRYVPPDGA